MNSKESNVFKIPIFYDFTYEKVSDSAVYLKGTYAYQKFLLIEYNISNNYEKEELYIKSIYSLNKNKYFLQFYGLFFNREMCQYFLVFEYPYYILDNFLQNKTISLIEKQKLFFEINKFLCEIDFNSEYRLENIILTSNFVFLNKQKQLKILCLGNLQYINSKTYDPDLNEIIMKHGNPKIKIDDFYYYKYSIFSHFYYENYGKFNIKKIDFLKSQISDNKINKKIRISACLFQYFKRDEEKIINLFEEEEKKLEVK